MWLPIRERLWTKDVMPKLIYSACEITKYNSQKSYLPFQVRQLIGVLDRALRRPWILDFLFRWTGSFGSIALASTPGDRLSLANRNHITAISHVYTNIHSITFVYVISIILPMVSACYLLRSGPSTRFSYFIHNLQFPLLSSGCTCLNASCTKIILHDHVQQL